MQHFQNDNVLTDNLVGFLKLLMFTMFTLNIFDEWIGHSNMNNILLNDVYFCFLLKTVADDVN